MGPRKCHDKCSARIDDIERRDLRRVLEVYLRHFIRHSSTTGSDVSEEECEEEQRTMLPSVYKADLARPPVYFIPLTAIVNCDTISN